LGAAGGGLDGCWVLWAVGAWQPPSWLQEPGWLLGPSGRAAGKGRSCEWEELEEALIYPVEYPRGRAGQGTAQADAHGRLPGGQLAASHPATHPTGPQFTAAEGCKPQTGIQGGGHRWGRGVPQHPAELKPKLFPRTAPKNQPRTTTVLVRGVRVPRKAQTEHPARVPTALEVWGPQHASMPC